MSVEKVVPGLVTSTRSNCDSGKSDHFLLAQQPAQLDDNPITAIYKLILTFTCAAKVTEEQRVADEKRIALGVALFNACTDEMLRNNQKQQEHPVLHELVQQWLSTSALCKQVWKIEHLKPYWDDRTYVDQYGLTVLERLVTCNSDLPRRKDRDYLDDIRWMAEELHVKPTERSSDAAPWEIKVVDYRV